jgi:acyl-coenzyme A synthetase/AMP-(fatty) acid ligase
VVVVAGEVLPAGLAAQLAPGRRFINVYGPTETTIAATWADSGRGDDVLSIGRPLPGYVAHVLDETYRPVPAGQTGELYVGGPAVALGYRNTPDLTAARFVPDPSAGNGSRMYRTGDLVAVRPDGLLEYRGRTDGQVKVRGFRIELAELERAAAAATPLRAAAAFVLPSGDALGLAVVTPPGTDADGCTARIREHCTATLPPQMVPAVVEAVPVIPTTTSGKVDRAALAASAGSRGDRPGRSATTERQVLVRDIWATLLARPVDDIDANFFELGGHSLLAAQAVAALRERTRLRLSVRHLLANPTVAGLARELDDLAGAAARASTPDTVPS